MTKIEFKKMLDSMAAAWTNRNYNTVAAQFTEQLFYSDALHYKFSNKSDLLAFFQDDGGHPQKCVFHNGIFDEETQFGAAEYSYHGNFCYHGTVWITIVNDKISEWREYQHISDSDWSEFWKSS